MKKLLLLLTIILLPCSLYSQLIGLGTFDDPYSGGNLRSSMTWSSPKVYISGVINIDGFGGRRGILTINPGVTVIFTTQLAGITVAGYGEINADGTLFTADSDNDGLYGEPGEVHRNLILESISPGTFSNCIFEYGSSPMGGAVKQVNHSHVFNSCIFRNNTATSVGGAFYIENLAATSFTDCQFYNNNAPEGGAVYTGFYSGPEFNNCSFYSNTSSGVLGGGAIFINENSAPFIANSLIYGNTASGTSGGGGIYIGSTDQESLGDAVIQNSVISNNSAAGQGNDIYVAGPYAFQISNTVAWGSANSVYYNTTPLPDNFVNSAIQRVYNSSGDINIGSFTECFILNSINDAADGPNFTDPAGSDYSISFESPLMDKGTFSVEPAPPTTDFEGNPRVGLPDIGAYEVQYSRWSTSAATTSWTDAGNWEGGLPSSERDILIPSGAANYPTGSTSQEFTIGAGKQMVIQPDAKLTLGVLTNNGTLKLQSTQLRSASVILGSYVRGTGGTEEIQLAVKGGITGDPDLRMYNWHYVSTPVNSLSTGVFTGRTLDLAHFVESLPEGDPIEGWIAFDGYNYMNPERTGPGFSSLTPGKGYDLYTESDEVFTFGGQFNVSDVEVDLSYRDGVPTLYGYNLIGNPFPSGLDWNAVLNSEYFPYPEETSSTIFFTRNNEPAVYAAGVGIPADVTGIIPPMQGFFTKTYNSGNSITLPAAARTHDNIHDRYKGAPEEIPLVRLAVSEGQMKDETVVRFDARAKTGLDYGFDAIKLFYSPAKTGIFTLESGSKYAINAQPFPGETLEIPLAVNFVSSGSHIISCSQLQRLSSYKVELIDKVTGLTTDLNSVKSITVNSAAGTITDRFILKFSNLMTGIEDPVITSRAFKIYQANSLVNIEPLADEWDGRAGSVTLLDLNGKPVNIVNNTEFRKGSLIQIQQPAVEGIYIVQIRSGLMSHAGRVIIK